MRNLVRIIGTSLALGFASLTADSRVAALSNTSGSATRPAGADHPTTRVSTELLDRIQKNLKDVKTVEADFVEEKNLSVLNHTLSIRGHFALQQPDRFIWIVREPVHYAIRVEGEEVRQWDEDTNHVDVIHLGGDPTFEAVSEQIRAWFLGNYHDLAKSYDMDILSDQPLSLGFTPKSDSSVARVLGHVDITFSEDERYIARMAVKEPGGDTTKLQFVHTQLNQPIKQEVWRIPPK